MRTKQKHRELFKYYFFYIFWQAHIFNPNLSYIISLKTIKGRRPVISLRNNGT